MTQSSHNRNKLEFNKFKALMPIFKFLFVVPSQNPSKRFHDYLPLSNSKDGLQFGNELFPSNSRIRTETR